MWKKTIVDKNGIKYILFRIDVYFIEFLLAVETDEKWHTDRYLIFEEKRQKALEKKLGYDLDYEVGKIEAFIDEFKNKKIKELEKEIREMRNEKLKNKN